MDCNSSTSPPSPPLPPFSHPRLTSPMAQVSTVSYFPSFPFTRNIPMIGSLNISLVIIGNPVQAPTQIFPCIHINIYQFLFIVVLRYADMARNFHHINVHFFPCFWLYILFAYRLSLIFPQFTLFPFHLPSSNM